MSLDTCIDELAADGRLTREQADRARSVYGAARAKRRETMGPAAADAAASDDALKALQIEAVEKRRRTLLLVKRQTDIVAETASYDGGKGQEKPGAAALALLDHDSKASYMNVAVQHQAIVGRAHAKVSEVFAKFSRNLVGEMRNKAEMIDVVRELFGQDTGNADAKEMATAWTAAAEELRVRFNQAGGAIGKLAKWGLPQSHDTLKVREAGRAAWKAFIAPLLDRGAMVDAVTGTVLDDSALDRALDHVFDTVSTDGWIAREPGDGGGRGSLAVTRGEHRFLHFRDADAWSAYHDRFGAGGTAFDAMMGHIHDMARDIAHMEVLGPNPAATIKWLQDGILKDAAMRGRKETLLSSAKGDAKLLGDLFDVTSGRTGIPVNAKWARGLSAARSAITAGKLGGALFSAWTDTGFNSVTRGFNGLAVTGAITDHLRLLASEGDRQGAIRLGLIADDASRKAAGIARYTGDSIAPGVASRLADGVLRLSGLSAWTQTGKWSYGMGELARATELAGHGFAALPEAYRAHLTRYGIDEAGWDGIRGSTRTKVSGTDFIDPTRIENRALGDRMLRMILTETAYAVPEVTARARATWNFGQPGTIAGEVGRSGLQFKSFAVSMLLTHGRRFTAETPYGRAKYAAALVVTTTLLGALSLQAKEIAKGRGVRPMDDGAFWLQAMAQGGGLGIFGDLFYSQAVQQLQRGSGLQRFGSTAELVGGPLSGLAGDAIRLGIIAPGQDAIDWYNDDPYRGRTAREGIRFAKGYVPGINLWYTRVAFERMVLDTLQSWIDPNYARSWEMMERHAAEQGQEFWWRPGMMSPDGPPQVDNAFDAPPERQE